MACKHGPAECKNNYNAPHQAKDPCFAADIPVKTCCHTDARSSYAGLGNIIELCAHKLYPDPKTYLGFVMCLTRNYKDIPQRSLIEDCALEHAIDFESLNECATEDDGAVGVGMLRDSIRRTTEVCQARPLPPPFFPYSPGGNSTLNTTPSSCSLS